MDNSFEPIQNGSQNLSADKVDRKKDSSSSSYNLSDIDK